MKKVLFLLLFTSLLIGLSVVESQAQHRVKKSKKKDYRFNAGLVVGLNFSQVDGDNFFGFNKNGLLTSLKGIMYLNERLDITTGITFVQRGSRFEDYQTGRLDRKHHRQIRLDYIEIPLLLTFKKLQKDGKGRRFDIGGSFARLFHSDIKEAITPFTEDFSYSALEGQFNNNEFNFIAGISHFFNSRMGLGLQFTYQINKVYDNPTIRYDLLNWNNPIKDVAYLRNYQITIQATYHIF